MKKTVLFIVILSFATFSIAYASETIFFGSFDSRVTSNENLEDADSNTDDQKDFMDSKLILGIESRFNEYLKGIASFEAGSIIWGIDGENYPVGRNTGGGPSGDGVNVETKNIYLDISVPERPVNLKCGLMPFSIAGDILAGDDAFGFTLSIGRDFNATLNMIRIYQESLGSRYNLNVGDPDRRENFVDLELSNKFNEYFSAGILAGYLADRYNGAKGNEIDRDIYYAGADLTLNTSISTTTLRYLYDTGKIEHSDVLGNTPVDIDLSGYLVDFTTSIDLGSVGIMIEYLIASGDDNFTLDKNEGFIVPETSYRLDIAEILTRGELTDELEGDDNYKAYQDVMDFNNIYFIKGAIDYQINRKTSTSLSVIYAALPKERHIKPGVIKAHRVGTEYDWKLSRVIYASDDMEKGLRLDFILAYLYTGDAFDVYDASTDTIKDADDIHEIGARLVYEF